MSHATMKVISLSCNVFIHYRLGDSDANRMLCIGIIYIIQPLSTDILMLCNAVNPHTLVSIRLLRLQLCMRVSHIRISSSHA